MTNKILLMMLGMILLLGIVSAGDLTSINYRDNVKEFSYSDIYCNDNACKVDVNITILDGGKEKVIKQIMAISKFKTTLKPEEKIVIGQIRETIKIEKTKGEIEKEFEDKQYALQSRYAKPAENKSPKPKWTLFSFFAKIFEVIKR
jgi:hypothetical protein